VDQLLEGVEDLRAIAQRLAEARGPDRQDHELLEVERVVGVRAAVDHVHHRDRQRHRARAAEVPVQRQAGLLCRGAGNRHRDGERRVGAEPRLVVRAVEVEQRPVDPGLLGGVQAHEGLGDLGIDVLDRAQHPLAEIAVRIAVAQLDRLARPGGRARGNRRPAHHAGFEENVAFDGRIAT